MTVHSPPTPTAQSSAFRTLVDSTAAAALAKAQAKLSGLAEQLRALVYVTFALMAGEECVPVAVPRGLVGQFVKGIGRRAADAGFVDVQFWLQERQSRTQEKVVAHGVVIDVDQRHADLLGLLGLLSLPLPNFFFETSKGVRLCYVFAEPSSARDAEVFATYLVLGIPGADPASARASQGQRTPGCARTTEGAIAGMPSHVHFVNGSPFDLAAWKPMLPSTVTRAIPGARAVSAQDRERIVRYLAGIDVVVPSARGMSTLQARCPLKAHSSKKAYVNVGANGDLSIHCCGGHGGTGPRTWREGELAALAMTGRHAPPSSFDLVRDVPYTWGGVELVKQAMLTAFAGEVGGDEKAALALALWTATKRSMEVDRLETRAGKTGTRDVLGAAVDDVFKKRLHGFDDVGPVRLFFCENSASFAILQADNKFVPITGSSFPLKSHLHERYATTALRVDVSVEASGAVAAQAKIEEYESKFDKAMRGVDAALRALGVPKLRIYHFPLAHRRTHLVVDDVERHLKGIIVPELQGGDPSFDVVEFFDRLRREGRLPLASRDDVVRFVMMLASPLLRELAPGLLGVYWIQGPSGSGKLFLFTCAERVWAAGAKTTEPASAQLSVTDDLELKRSFASAGDALYLHAPEAAKRSGMIDQLIHLSGSAFLAARGMRKDEVRTRNTFTFVADSVEDIVDRREVHRRTVVINTRQDLDDKGKGAALREITERAPDILAALKATVESKPESWYREQDRLGSRPVVPVALSRLFNVDLPEVKGSSLIDLFEAMRDYVDHYGREEATRERAKAREKKDGKLLTRVPSYRIEHFLDEMRQRSGHRAALATFSSRTDVLNVLRREREYRPGDRSGPPYLPVEIGGDWFALKVVKANRNFIFMPEAAFCAAAELPVPIHPENTSKSGTASASAASASAAPSPPGPGGAQESIFEGTFADVAASGFAR